MRAGQRQFGIGMVIAAWTLLAIPLPATPVSKGSDLAGPAGRDDRYLEIGLGQLRRLEKAIHRLDEQRLGAGALAAAALAARGGTEAPAHRSDAIRWATAALGSCGPSWARNNCERTQIALQRLALQYPEVLPAELRQRLR
ncbi:MAG TPA: hypothetical protein VHU81_13280, partial [Thermoanaerobaculia bacterium]|nr:hypothetical protein [Thermoanaerobaculia bacterium]